MTDRNLPESFRYHSPEDNLREAVEFEERVNAFPTYAALVVHNHTYGNARVDASECGCRGRGWILSPYDTWESCPFHEGTHPYVYEEEAAFKLNAMEAAREHGIHSYETYLAADAVFLRDEEYRIKEDPAGSFRRVPVAWQLF